MSSRAVKKPRNIHLAIAAKTGREHVPYLKKHLTQALRLLPSRLTDLSIALVGDQLMARLHERFMNIAGPTDVLTFELAHGPKGFVTEGEVVICVPEARRRAREYGTLPAHELLLYAIHGLLHLSGYDDRTESEFRKIHREEDRMLKKLGIGPVFEPGRKLRTPGKKVGR